MKFFKRNIDKNITAMVSGHTYPIESVDDKVFSSKLMGEGIAIEPSEGVVYAPNSGKVLFVNEEMPHSIGMKLDMGLEIMIHIGINTVNLSKDIFDLKVKQNKKVKKGDVLIEFNKKEILRNGCSDMVMLIITDNDKYSAENYQFFVEKDVIGGKDVIIGIDK